MTSSRARNVAGLLAFIAAVGVCSVVWGQPAPNPKDKLAALAESRVKAAQKAYDTLFEPSRKEHAAHPDLESVYLWSHRWLEAELAAATTAEARRGAYRGHRDRIKEQTERYINPSSSLPVSPFRKAAAEFFLTEAEFWVAKSASD